MLTGCGRPRVRLSPFADRGERFSHRLAYTADGHTAAWLDHLDQLERDLSGLTLYPGHGPARDTALLTGQRQYLLMYRETIRRLAGGQPKLTDPQREELEHVMRRFLPGAPLTWMIGLGADAVCAELAAEPQQPAA